MLKIQLVHHVADHAGEKLALYDGEEFVVRIPSLCCTHWRARLFDFFHELPGQLCNGYKIAGLCSGRQISADPYRN